MITIERKIFGSSQQFGEAYLLGHYLLFWLLTQKIINKIDVKYMHCSRKGCAAIGLLLMIGIVVWFAGAAAAEGFTSGKTHTVDLPLNTSYHCQNFCGPGARCAMTGQQCFTDIDCPGCRPLKAVVMPDNDSGKSVPGMAPGYSSLTGNVFDTFKRLDTDSDAPPAKMQYDGTLDVYSPGSAAAVSQSLFKRRFTPPDDLEYMPKYPTRRSFTNDFVINGPLPANY